MTSANVGPFRLSKPQIERETYVCFVHDGVVVEVARILYDESVPDVAFGTRMLHTRALDASSPIRAAYIGRSAPLNMGLRETASFFDQDIDGGECECGCGQLLTNWRRFRPGHSQDAVMVRVNKFASIRAFINWFDSQEIDYAAANAAVEIDK